MKQDYKKMGILETDRLVDLSMLEIIEGYERDLEPIHLSPCDYETPLKAAYNCKDSIKYNRDYAVLDLRNEHIVKEVINSKEKNIIMIYGRSHWKPIWYDLMDAGFEITHGRMFFKGIY